MNEKLPVGSVIIINNKEDKYFIVGKDIEKDGIKYDYMCIVYPYGWVVNQAFYFFQDEEVDSLAFLGNINRFRSDV